MLLSIGNCLLCGCFDELHVGVCIRCDKSIASELFSSYASSFCPECGAPLLHRDSVCNHLGQQDPVHIIKAGFYSDFLKDLIIRYKFSPCRALSAYLASMISPLLRSKEEPLQKLWIVCVPCSVKGLRSRGWDQMEAIAELLVKTPLTIKIPLLKRVDGKEQKLKTRERRLDEIESAFVLRKRFPATSREWLTLPDRIVVIDDVYTTGATMHACIKLLQLHFACRVSGICLAMD